MSAIYEKNKDAQLKIEKEYIMVKKNQSIDQESTNKDINFLNKYLK